MRGSDSSIDWKGSVVVGRESYSQLRLGREGASSAYAIDEYGFRNYGGHALLAHGA
jgi:hypothetical protein